jgi:hypothetical protein
MRVFCPEHKRGFFAPRQSPIKCENKGHTLGQLDFDGEAQTPVELQWQYCCNCEHFCPIDVEQDGLERCPVCTRGSSMLYLCDRCYTISFESNTPIQTKNFTLRSDGAPQPSCPGCLRTASADLHEHTCDVLGASLITTLNSCPICGERLDIGPSFPSLVAHYLKRTKGANKVNVTFDYESGLFVPVEDGEFVLVSNGNAAQPIVLPRSASFTTKRDFYEFYQDYYHCTKPDAGPVHIIQPAVVVPTSDGWRLHSPGILEVLEDQPMKKASTDGAGHEVISSVGEEPGVSIEAINESPVAPGTLEVRENHPKKTHVAGYEESTSAREEPAPSMAARKESPVAPCTHCGSLIETRYAFCWRCGNSLTRKNGSSITRSIKAMPLAEIATGEDEVTLQHDVSRGDAPIFSWASTKEPAWTESTKGSVLKVIAVAVVVLVLVSLGLFLLMRLALPKTPVTDAQPVPPKLQADQNLAPGQGRTADLAGEAKPQPISTVRSEDDALKTLRERRTGARTSDRPAILQAFARAEKQYPNDYRFPYERAKLAIIGSKSSSHDEAFAALSLAAQKAIKAGKAHEMLEGLETDADGDFHRLSHGHHQWKELLEVLKNKDTSLLSARLRL